MVIPTSFANKLVYSHPEIGTDFLRSLVDFAAELSYNEPRKIKKEGNTMKIVIVGGVAAGTKAAAKLMSENVNAYV